MIGPSVRIVTDNTYLQSQNGLPTFLRQHGVYGELQIESSDDCATLEKVKIVLKGTMTNAIGHRCLPLQHNYDVLYDDVFLELVDVQTLPTGDDNRKVPFDFHLGPSDPVTASHNPSLNSLSQSLPSSLTLRVHDGSFCPYAQPIAFGQPAARCIASTRVKYEIQACAYNSADEIVASARKEIGIFDVADLEPAPVHVPDFGPEYALGEAQRFTKRFSFGRQSNSVLRVTASEPTPLVLSEGFSRAEDKDDTPVVAVKIPLRFEVVKVQRKSKGEASGRCSVLNEPNPGAMKVTINSAMRSMTFVSMAAMDKQPTFDDRSCCGSSATWSAQLARHGAARQTTLQIDAADWVPGEEGEEAARQSDKKGPTATVTAVELSDDESEQQSSPPSSQRQKKIVWTATKNLYFLNAPSYSPLPPTFFTPHLARRYAIGMRLDAKGKKGTATICLTAPLAVVYEPPSSRSPSVHQMNGEAPKYEDVIEEMASRARHDSLLSVRTSHACNLRRASDESTEAGDIGAGSFELELAEEVRRRGVPPVYAR